MRKNLRILLFRTKRSAEKVYIPPIPKWQERSETNNMFCKSFPHTLVFKDAELMVFAFWTNLSAENLELFGVSGNRRKHIFGDLIHPNWWSAWPIVPKFIGISDVNNPNCCPDQIHRCVYIFFNTTLHPKLSLKICGFFKICEKFDQISNSHRFVKICENLAQIPQLLSGVKTKGEI